MRRLSFFLISTLLLPGRGAAEHNPLLPRPQELRYGSEQLPVQGLTIHFASAPSAEDRFAAEALNGCLARRGVATLTIAAQPGVAGPPSILLKRDGEGPALPMPDERAGPESREAYELRVTAMGAEVRAHSSTGLFYGVQTLCQLAEGGGQNAERSRQENRNSKIENRQKAEEPSTVDRQRSPEAVMAEGGARLPAVEIRDWPALAYRGVMMDMSHGPLPTVQEVERQLDFLARWKENQYYFYNEASIELEGYRLLNPRGRFTQEQVRRIIAYGRERHIDVIPCLELYGHMHDLFRIEKYSDLAALPHGGEFNPANPQVLPLLTDWVNQFAQLFPSPFVHIGFDETWEIERAAKEQGAGATPAKLFVRQLGNVARLFQQHGKRVMLWGDIPIKYPDILSELPSGLIVVAWEYDPRDPEYKRWMQPITERHLPHFIATGVNSWDEIAPDFPLAFENIDTFLAAGRKSGTLGLMNTVWSDDAQLLLRLSWPAMAYGAAAPWQSSPMDRAHFFSDYASAMYPPATAAEVAAALESLAKAEVSLQKVLGQETMLELWKDPFAPPALKQSTQHREDLHQARLLAEDAAEHLDRALAHGADPADLNSLLVGSELLDYAGMKFQYAVEIGERWRDLGAHPTGDQLWVLFESEVTTSDHARLPDLMDAISELRESYRQAWLQEYTPYRLASALGRWDAEYEYWRRLQARLRAFLASYHKGEPLPSLESVVSGPKDSSQ